jgi:hypothetical protein
MQVQPERINAVIANWNVNLSEQLVVQAYLPAVKMVFVEGISSPSLPH